MQIPGPHPTASDPESQWLILCPARDLAEDTQDTPYI